MTPAKPTKLLALAVAAGISLSACGGSAATTSAPATEAPATAGPETATGEPFFELIAAADAQAIIDSAPADLVVLDVRTPEEFDEAHIDGATLVDFYDSDFADQLDQLDKDVPYVLYCRSGNRSGQTAQLMRTLGFTEVHEIDGGLNSWQSAGLPTQ